MMSVATKGTTRCRQCGHPVHKGYEHIHEKEELRTVHPVLRRNQVERFGVSVFTGRLRWAGNNHVKMCDLCGKEPAMWQHELMPKVKRPDGLVHAYVCFGCGGH